MGGKKGEVLPSALGGDLPEGAWKRAEEEKVNKLLVEGGKKRIKGPL